MAVAARINADKFLSPDYLDMVKTVAKNIIIEDNVTNARDLVQIFTEALGDGNVKSKITEEYRDFYHEILIKLKFISLPLLEDPEIISLLSDNFTAQFQLENYNLLDKFQAKLLTVILVDDRNNLKKKILDGLFKNQESIVTAGSIKKIGDWLKNYIAHIGLDSDDQLSRAQYLVSLKSDKDIIVEEYDHLTILFKFYDELNIPADSPAGFNEEPLVKVGDRLYVFKKGMMEPIINRKELVLASATLNNSSNNQGVSQRVVSASSSPASSTSAAPSPAETLAELETALKNYPEGSLEHKALKQEINRLKVAQLKAAQKSSLPPRSPKPKL